MKQVALSLSELCPEQRSVKEKAMRDLTQLAREDALGLLILAMMVSRLAVTLLAADRIIPPESKVDLVARAKPVETTPFTEGPAYHRSGQLYFTDVSNSRILCVNVKTRLAASSTQLEIFRESSGHANGLAFDLEGRLLACEGSGSGGNRRVTRTEKDGRLTVLAEKLQGKRLNSPNDLTVDAQGRIYFTDPRYGDRAGMELDQESVYRIDPDGKLARVINDVERPNGIAVAPNQKTLYVVDNNPERGGAREVYAYELRADGSTGRRRVVHDFGSGRGGDGMCLDSQGNLYVTAGLNSGFSPAQDNSVKAGVYVLSPLGTSLGFVPVPEDSVTNCTFGDADLKTLYITAGTALWRIRVNAVGYELPAASRP
jgi:gluconolactonase